MLSAIIDSPAPKRYGRQSRLRSAANFGGAAIRGAGGASTTATASGSTTT